LHREKLISKGEREWEGKPRIPMIKDEKGNCQFPFSYASL
jgi:hypothetical protein